MPDSRTKHHCPNKSGWIVLRSSRLDTLTGVLRFSRNPAEIQNAVQALGAAGRRACSAVPLIQRAGQTSGGSVQLRAAQALNQIGPPRARNRGATAISFCVLRPKRRFVKMSLSDRRLPGIDHARGWRVAALLAMKTG
jgi:hypothetical protein